MTWQTKKLGEICEIRMGETLIKKNLTGEGIPVYSADSLEKPWGFTSKHRVEFPKGTLVIGARGTIGSVKLPRDEKFTCTQTTIAITPNSEEISPFFLFYFLRKVNLSALKARGSIPMLTISRVSQVEIPLLPFSIQQKIVKILDIIQEAIDIQEKIIEKTKELKKSLTANLFRYGAPSFREGRKLRKTEIGEIPEDWKMVKLGSEDLFEIKLGGTPKTNIPEYWNGSINWITPNDLSQLSGVYIQRTERKISEKGLKNGSNLLKESSIILSTRAPIGYVAILSKAMAFNQGCKGIEIKEENRVNNFYLYYFLFRSRFKLNELGSGSTFRELSTEDLKNFQIPLPPLPEQQEITEILQTVDQKIAIEQKKKELYEELFKTILNKIMNQEIDVERIKI